MKIIQVLLIVCMVFAMPVAMAKDNSILQQQYLPVKAKESSKYVVRNTKHAARLVKKRYGGKVLSSKRSSKSAYKVKLLKSDGNIVSVYVNAKTGKMKV